MSRTREVFPTGSTTLLRLQLSRTRDCAHRSRHVGLFLFLFFFFFWRERCLSKVSWKSNPAAPGLANQVWPFKSAIYVPGKTLMVGWGLLAHASRGHLRWSVEGWTKFQSDDRWSSSWLKMKPSCSRKGTPLELRVNKKREDQVRSEESSQESESSAADAQQKVRRWSSESTKSERIRSDRKNLLRSLSRQQQMPRAYSQLSLSLFSSFKSRKLQKVKVVPRLFTSHPHSYNNVITMLFTDDAIRGQLLFRFHNNTISLTKALIVETFEKNKNIFVSPIASSVNHCPKSKAKLI